MPVAEKMSKARGNVVNPDDVVREFGADSLRVYEMFMGPLEQVKPWQTSGIQGVRRFLDRVYALAYRDLDPGPMDEETSGWSIGPSRRSGRTSRRMRFNTAISAMMILANHLQTLEPPPARRSSCSSCVSRRLRPTSGRSSGQPWATRLLSPRFPGRTMTSVGAWMKWWSSACK